MEINETIKHCQSGNKIAQAVLFDTYYQKMYHLSMRLLSNQHDVEDVLIVAFTKIFKNIGKFEYRGEFSLEKWIKTIVINESVRLINSKPKIAFIEILPEAVDLETTDMDFPNIDAESVYAILENMPAGYRIVFNLFAIEGYSHKEISTLLKVSENTSKSQLRKARIYISQKLNKDYNYGKEQSGFGITKNYQ